MTTSTNDEMEKMKTVTHTLAADYASIESVPKAIASAQVVAISEPWIGDPDWVLEITVPVSDEGALGEFLFKDPIDFIAGCYSYERREN
jgi:2,4-dienoyl-CoA reductase-like NADH-dependent reductase (Old Yellow Enzyme family)